MRMVFTWRGRSRCWGSESAARRRGGTREPSSGLEGGSAGLRRVASGQRPCPLAVGQSSVVRRRAWPAHPTSTLCHGSEPSQEMTCKFFQFTLSRHPFIAWPKDSASTSWSHSPASVFPCIRNRADEHLGMNRRSGPGRRPPMSTAMPGRAMSVSAGGMESLGIVSAAQ